MAGGVSARVTRVAAARPSFRCAGGSSPSRPRPRAWCRAAVHLVAQDGPGFAPIYYRRGATAPSAVSRADIKRLSAAQQRLRLRRAGRSSGDFNCKEQSCRAGRGQSANLDAASLPTQGSKGGSTSTCSSCITRSSRAQSGGRASERDGPATSAWPPRVPPRAACTQQLAQHALPTMRLQASEHPCGVRAAKVRGAGQEAGGCSHRGGCTGGCDGQYVPPTRRVRGRCGTY